MTSQASHHDDTPHDARAGARPDATARRVAALIDELFGVPADALGPDVELQDGLQLDSLSVLELQTALEDTFDIRFDDPSTAEVTTYGRLVAVVREAVLRKARSA